MVDGELSATGLLRGTVGSVSPTSREQSGLAYKARRSTGFHMLRSGFRERADSKPKAALVPKVTIHVCVDDCPAPAWSLMYTHV